MGSHLEKEILIKPIWKVSFKDDLSFFVLGKNKTEAMQNVLYDPLLSKDNIKDIQRLNIRQSKSILISTDDDDSSLSTLFEEAIWVQTVKDPKLFVATCFDVIINLNTELCYE